MPPPAVPAPGHAVPAPGRTAPATGLGRFNAQAPGVVETALLACCGCRRWARRIAAHRPYPDLESLLAAADEASYDMTPADVAEALADESGAPGPSRPRPAERSGADTVLRAAHAAYESRFGHVFVLCLDGLAPGKRLDALLTSLRARLNHDPEEERRVAADEMRRLAQVRLVHLVADQANPAAPNPSTAAGG